MLIEFDSSLYTYLDGKLDQLNVNSLEVIALNNLAIAYKQGWHILIGPLKLLKLIKKIECLDSSTKSVFEKLINEYTFQKSYKDIVNEYILIENNQEETKGENIEKVIFRCPLTNFARLSNCFKTTLLCEDETDYDFYTKFVKKFIKEQNNINNLNTTFSSGNGGGANSFKVLERQINENGNPILAIADSDKKYPNGSEGQTLKQLNKIKNKYEENIIGVYSTQVRAKENLLSPSLYLLGVNPSSKQHLEMLKKIEEKIDICDRLLYLNIKDGYKVKHFNDTEFREYYDVFFAEIQKEMAFSLEGMDSDKQAFPGMKGIVEQFTYNILDDGLEKQLLEKSRIPDITEEIRYSINELERKIEKKNELFNQIPQYLTEYITQLCRKLISWGCSKGEFLST